MVDQHMVCWYIVSKTDAVLMKYSAQQLEAFEAFSEQVDILEGQVRTLKSRLSELAGRNQVRSWVFALERPTEDDAPPAKPDPRQGDKALQSALEALSDWYAPPGYATKAVHRTPGVLALDDLDEQQIRDIADQVEQINATKARLREHMKRMGHPDARFELIHSRFFMIVVTQLTRRLTLLQCPPEIQSVTFSWGFKTEIRRLSVDQACQLLERQKGINARCEEYDVPWSERVSIEQARLRSLGDNIELRWRRPLPVRPLANIRWAFTESEKDKRDKAKARGEEVASATIMREAHTPLIILNPSRGMRVGSLAPFDEAQRIRRQQRADRKSGMTPATDIAPIYLVE